MLVTLIVFAAIALICVVVSRVKHKNLPVLIIGDDKWDGTFPCEAPEFRGPAYVYEDGQEASAVRFNVPILGYRATETLIVSVNVGYDFTADKLSDFAKQKHARLPESKDLKVLEANRNQINGLKNAVEDFPLPNDFWVMVDGKPEIYRSAMKSIILANKRSLGRRSAEVVLLIDR